MGVERKDAWFHHWLRSNLRQHMAAALPLVDQLRKLDPDRAARIEALLAEVLKEVEDAS
jgi:ABC-type Zn uptake system ZnuABC Zn-binding protein ZnuA